MNFANTKRAGWKSKVIREMTEYCIISMYLAFFFGLFTWYRRLILVQYEISYLHYGVSVIQALVLAKVIMVGRALRLGRRFNEHPLILPTLYKAFVFTIFVGFFGVFEYTISGLQHGKGIAGGFDELMSAGRCELLARCMVTFVAFIPFFAFDELERVLGEGTLGKLFFRRRSAAESDLSYYQRPGVSTADNRTDKEENT
ncbi:MAG: hypothetical protein WB930_01040 [Syntrophobacteraceae bacterium]